MKKKFLIFLFICLITIVGTKAEEQNIGCCVIGDQDNSCTYWDVPYQFQGGIGEAFCNSYTDNGLSVQWFTEPCDESYLLEMSPEWCSAPKSGFSFPEFSFIGAGIALVGSGLGFVLLRKKK